MIHLGPSGWSYGDWVDRVYPHTTRGPQGLALLLRVFSFVEINSTFYGDPDQRSQRAWLELAEAHPGAQLGFKLHRRFTHQRDAADPRALSEDLKHWRVALGPLLKHPARGPLLVQFPASFGPTASHPSYVRALLVELSDLCPVVELRSRRWWEPAQAEPLLALGASLAHIDLPAHPDHPPPLALGPIAYLRLHGRNRENWFRAGATRDERYDYLYTPQELALLAARLREYEVSGRAVYAATNNHFQGQAVANALDLALALGRAPARVPALWLSSFGHLAGALQPMGQGELFD